MRCPKEVTTKDTRRVQQGKDLQEHNCKSKNDKERIEQIRYVIEVIVVVGVIGGLGCYLYQAKKGVEPSPQQSPQRSCPKFEMD